MLVYNEVDEVTAHYQKENGKVHSTKSQSNPNSGELGIPAEFPGALGERPAFLRVVSHEDASVNIGKPIESARLKGDRPIQRGTSAIPMRRAITPARCAR